MRSDFKENYLNEIIEEQGFAIVPFATQEEIREIKAFYQTLPHIAAKGTYVTMFNPSAHYRKMVDDKIKDIFADRVNTFLKEYRALFANFMVKEIGKEGDFPVHQDWTYVDESRFSSYAFWVPMQDVNCENGALSVVPGSHKYRTALRGPGVYDPLSVLSEVIKSSYSRPMNLKAGEALIWDHRLIHFSRPNFSSMPRLAFTLIMVPENVDVFHCYGRNNQELDKIEIYAVHPDFYLDNIIGQPPMNVSLIKIVDQERLNFNISQFEKALKIK